MTTTGFHEHPSLAAACERVAAAIASVLTEAAARRPSASLVLAGGSTPHGVYERLAAPDGPSMPWQRVHLYWGDERCVPPDDPASNYRMARRALLDRVPVPPANVHRIRGELPPREAATCFDAELRQHFPAVTWPTFDLVLLGMGSDGHTASLFPDDPLLGEAIAWVGVTDGRSASPPVPRVSLTLGAINGARRVLFLVSGADKRAVVEAIRAGAPAAERYPAARVRPAGMLEWHLI